MRLIKLSREEFDSREEVVSYFNDPDSEFKAWDKDFGTFRYTRNHIAPDGVTVGERLLFSYDGEVIYAAKAASAPLPAHGPESEEYPYYLQVELASLREMSLTLAELEQVITSKVDRTLNLRGQGWTRLPDHDALDDAIMGLALQPNRDDSMANLVSHPRQLSLIGTWKEVHDEHEAVEAAIEERGGWASWWSFPVDEAAQDLLTSPFYIYLNKGGGIFAYRMKVVEYQTSRGNEGILSPWPELTDEDCKNASRAGNRQSQIFKTWLRISEIEKLVPPLTLEHMTLADSLSTETNVLNQNRFGYVYLKDSQIASKKKEQLPRQPVYSLVTCSEETGLEQELLLRWVKAIDRKGQAVVYGPPGTGKTYVAERLARHFVGGGDGFTELVQFHPSYSYEDFIQGIRPQAGEDGCLNYPLVPGRFLEFCEKAKKRTRPCVLILDEINRANLSRVFGELMYLLEYRDKDIPLAGGKRFSIPSNVRIIGTMNTADRSIALVDHALRRRFAFLELYPNYDILKKFHEGKEFAVTGLVETLRWVNQQIGDNHYKIGISFFLKDDIECQIEDIWQMEIEPYLEEYFFDQFSRVEELRWAKLKQRVILG